MTKIKQERQIKTNPYRRIALSTFLATTVNFAFVSGEGTGEKP